MLTLIDSQITTKPRLAYSTLSWSVCAGRNGANTTMGSKSCRETQERVIQSGDDAEGFVRSMPETTIGRVSSHLSVRIIRIRMVCLEKYAIPRRAMCMFVFRM